MSDVYHDENGIEVESPKSTPVQSAEELAEKLRGAIQLIKADRAAQRQAGREEMRSELVEGYAANILELAKRYAALEEAAREIIEWMEINEEMADFGNPPLRIKVSKALSDLVKARRW